MRFIPLDSKLDKISGVLCGKHLTGFIERKLVAGSKHAMEGFMDIFKGKRGQLNFR